MPRYEQLDNIRHRDLCVATGFGAHFGDNMAMVPVVPAEFRQLQREYTIFFRKDPAGGFQSVALLASSRTRTCTCRVRAGLPPACRPRSRAVHS